MTPRLAVLASAAILAAAGCRRGPFVGVSFQTMNNPFFIDLAEGLESVVAERGYRLEVRDAQWNSLKQKNDMADLVMGKAAAIFLNPVNWEGVTGSLEFARSKGIPTIVVDAPVSDPSLVLATVASDNFEAGRLAARALAEACRPARIAILHRSVNKACIDRVAGFREEVSRRPDMEIVEVQEGGGTTEGARPVMLDLIARRPDLNAVFAINDPSALGAISALESAGKLSQVKVASVDGAEEALRAIQEGKLLSTSAQFPREIGRKAAEVALRHLAGDPVEKSCVVRVELVTKENVEAFLSPSGAKPR
ncbi:MAG: sugar ABC transporter substrate-binding protein [Planctomycetota bacterium]